MEICREIGSEILSERRNKGKVSIVLNKAPRHEDLCGSGVTAPDFLHIGSRWRRVVSFMPRPLHFREKISPEPTG
jgi:hypothetical protein